VFNVKVEVNVRFRKAGNNCGLEKITHNELLDFVILNITHRVIK
jgi:hypothetical protein